jgi:hypothetical protein
MARIAVAKSRGGSANFLGWRWFCQLLQQRHGSSIWQHQQQRNGMANMA